MVLTCPWTPHSGALASGHRPGQEMRQDMACEEAGAERVAGTGCGVHRVRVSPTYLAQSRCHFVGQRPGHDHHIGLARAGSEDNAEAVHVVAWRCHVHHFHGAAGQAKGHGPHGALRIRRCRRSEGWGSTRVYTLERLEGGWSDRAVGKALILHTYTRGRSPTSHGPPNTSRTP